MTKVYGKKANVASLFGIGIVNFSRVEDAFNRGPIRMQRSHSKRAPKVKHIKKVLTGEQLIFHTVMWQGVERLIDGYTRVERIITTLTNRPDTVGLVTHEEPSTETDLIALYDQFNSSAALKNAGDRFDEGLRMSELLDTLKSTLCIYGQKSAGQYATDSLSIREGVVAAAKGIQFVDNLWLSKNSETLGVLATYYAIGLHGEFCGAKAVQFIRKVNQRYFAPQKPTEEDLAILRFRQFNEAKRDAGSHSGVKNVTAIRNKGLQCFLDYMGFLHLLPADEKTVSLGSFVTVLTQAKPTYTV